MHPIRVLATKYSFNQTINIYTGKVNILQVCWNKVEIKVKLISTLDNISADTLWFKELSLMCKF